MVDHRPNFKVKIRFIVPVDSKDGDLTNSRLSMVEYRFMNGEFAGRETFVLLSPIHKNCKYYEINNTIFNRKVK